LAWLVVGYARLVDRDYARSIDALAKAKPQAGDLGDYVDYYLGTAYLQAGRKAEAMATLANFETTHQDSLLVRDVHVSYAGVLVQDGRASEAVALLEKDRLPFRSDVEFALGKAYAASGQSAKAAEALANVYYTAPTSAEADSAYTELKKIPSAPRATTVQL